MKCDRSDALRFALLFSLLAWLSVGLRAQAVEPLTLPDSKPPSAKPTVNATSFADSWRELRQQVASLRAESERLTTELSESLASAETLTLALTQSKDSYSKLESLLDSERAIAAEELAKATRRAEWWRTIAIVAGSIGGALVLTLGLFIAFH